MTAEFEDALARVVHESMWTMAGGGECLDGAGAPNAGDHQIAFDVLRSPDMRAIKRQLLGMAVELTEGCNDEVNHGNLSGGSRLDGAKWWLSECLPSHVVKWVMSSE